MTWQKDAFCIFEVETVKPSKVT